MVGFPPVPCQWMTINAKNLCREHKPASQGVFSPHYLLHHRTWCLAGKYSIGDQLFWLITACIAFASPIILQAQVSYRLKRLGHMHIHIGILHSDTGLVYGIQRPKRYVAGRDKVGRKEGGMTIDARPHRPPTSARRIKSSHLLLLLHPQPPHPHLSCSIFATHLFFTYPYLQHYNV